MEKMSLKFTFKNINRVASSNVKRQIVPISKLLGHRRDDEKGRQRPASAGL